MDGNRVTETLRDYKEKADLDSTIRNIAASISRKLREIEEKEEKTPQ
jgi:hypothetical protein